VQHFADGLNHVLLLELARRKVHRHPDPRQPRLLPSLVLDAGLVQDPLPHRDDQTGAFRDRDKIHRPDQAEFRVLPADQRFRPDDLAGRQINLRLVIEDELFAFECATETVFQNDPFFRFAAHLGGINLVVVFSFLFGAVERGVGVAQQGLDAFPIFRIEAHADMGDDVEVFILAGEGRMQVADDLVRHGVGLMGPLDLLKNQKFVSAQARQDAFGIHAFAQAPGHLLQQKIPHGMTERMINDLQAIQIQKDDRDAMSGLLGAHQRFPEPGIIKRPGRKSG